jgi:hypothetical protein
MFLATVKVTDLQHFLNTFATKGAQKRKEYGSRGSQVFRDPGDSSRVWVVFDWEPDAFKRFIADPEAASIFQEAGLQGPPVKAEPAGEYDS